MCSPWNTSESQLRNCAMGLFEPKNFSKYDIKMKIPFQILDWSTRSTSVSVTLYTWSAAQQLFLRFKRQTSASPPLSSVEKAKNQISYADC